MFEDMLVLAAGLITLAIGLYVGVKLFGGEDEETIIPKIEENKVEPALIVEMSVPQPKKKRGRKPGTRKSIKKK